MSVRTIKAQHGSFVMNTRDEIIAAIRDYQAGKFADLPGQVA